MNNFEFIEENFYDNKERDTQCCPFPKQYCCKCEEVWTPVVGGAEVENEVEYKEEKDGKRRPDGCFPPRKKTLICRCREIPHFPPFPQPDNNTGCHQTNRTCCPCRPQTFKCQCWPFHNRMPY